MIRKHKTKEEWQQIVDDFIPEQQTQKAYCKEKNIKHGAFKNWYQKLKAGGDRVNMSETKSDVSADLTKGVLNKEFIGFKLLPSVTKISLPNGINLEVATGDVVGLIKKLLHVA